MSAQGRIGLAFGDAQADIRRHLVQVELQVPCRQTSLGADDGPQRLRAAYLLQQP